MRDDIGFLYVATGKMFVEEAIDSVTSLKSKCATVPSAIFTDKQNAELAMPYFDKVMVLETPQYNFIDKIEPLIKSPFDKTIFIDTDTFIAEDLTDLFSLLSNYDFLASFAPGRGVEAFSKDVPDYFPEFNTGLIGYSNIDLCHTVLTLWANIYKEQLKLEKKPPHDQPSFRNALFQSNARIFCLPSEYNFRITNPNIVWSNSSIKLIHGRHNHYEQLVQQLNKDKNAIRIFYHDARFIKNGSIRFFNLRQSRSLLFKCGLWLYGLKERLRYRLFNDDLPKKIKGN